MSFWNSPPSELDSLLTRVKQLGEQTLDTVQSTSKLAAEAVGDANIPGLSVALSTVAKVLTTIQARNSPQLYLLASCAKKKSIDRL